MKPIQLLCAFILSFFILGCSSDDQVYVIAEDPGIRATIDGGTYSDYNYQDGVYEITSNGNGSVLSIDSADINGDMLTLFLNATGGFDAGVVKDMGNVDENNFVTYVLIRQQNLQLSYYSDSGQVTITSNVPHPTEEGTRLISGTFEVSASSTTPNHTTTITGAFIDLSY